MFIILCCILKVVGLSTLYFWAAGFVTVSAIVFALPNWRMAFLAMSLPTLAFINFSKVIPESPMWLISQGRIPEAQQILNEAASRNGLNPVTELAKIVEEVDAEDHDYDERYLNLAKIVWNLETILAFCLDTEKSLTFTTASFPYLLTIVTIARHLIQKRHLNPSCPWSGHPELENAL